MRKVFNIMTIACLVSLGTSACDANTTPPVTPSGGFTVTVDDMVGTWQVSGHQVYNSGGQSVDIPTTHTLTISRIDDQTVEIKDMLGLSTYHSYMSTEDRFTATIKENTISIPAQLMSPSFVTGEDEVYMCRWKYSDTGVGFGPNWMLGFENIPIKSNMTIDLSDGSFLYDRLTTGEHVYPSFIFLSHDSADTYYYGWFYYNTVWKKIK